MLKENNRTISFPSELLTKTIALFMGFFIIFNIIFSFPAPSLSFKETSQIQKDVFSAILVVSDTINKISKNLSDRFIAADTEAPLQKDEKQQPLNPAVEEKAVVTTQTQNNKTVEKSYTFKSITFYEKEMMFNDTSPFLNNGHAVFLCYFLIMMLFFIATKKPGNGALRAVYENITK